MGTFFSNILSHAEKLFSSFLVNYSATSCDLIRFIFVIMWQDVYSTHLIQWILPLNNKAQTVCSSSLVGLSTSAYFSKAGDKLLKLVT